MYIILLYYWGQLHAPCEYCIVWYEYFEYVHWSAHLHSINACHVHMTNCHNALEARGLCHIWCMICMLEIMKSKYMCVCAKSCSWSSMLRCTITKPHPMAYFAWRGFTLCLSACVSVKKISKNIQPISSIFGGSLPCDPGRKPFNFEKNRPGVRVGVGVGSKFGPNDKRFMKLFFEWLSTPKRCKLDM